MCSTKPKFIIYCVFLMNQYNGIKRWTKVNCVVVTFASKAHTKNYLNI